MSNKMFVFEPSNFSIFYFNLEQFEFWCLLFAMMC